MDIRNIKGITNALPDFKVGVGRKERDGGVSQRPHHSPDVIQTHRHFHFMTIFYEVLVITRFELDHSVAVKAATWLF